MTQRAVMPRDLIADRLPGSALAKLVLVLLGSALLAVSAKVQVPMVPVPVTMQTLAVLLIGMAYGPRLGAATCGAYLLEGAVGLPVFANGGGIAYFAGPTAGYLLSYPLAAGLVGWLAERGWDRSFARVLAANLIGTVVIFVLGVAWLAFYVVNPLAAGLVPFLPGAVLKIVLAALLLPAARQLLGRR